MEKEEERETKRKKKKTEIWRYTSLEIKVLKEIEKMFKKQLKIINKVILLLQLLIIIIIYRKFSKFKEDIMNQITI